MSRKPSINPITQRRIDNFKANRRGYYSLWVFLFLFLFTLFAEFVSNDKPLLVYYDGSVYIPIFNTYTETEFGGDFETEADYRDSYIQDLINDKGWMIWPLIRYSYKTINYDLPVPAPAPPSSENWLGTDDQGRDVVARLIYGFRISILFALSLTFLSTIVGVIVGATQGYYGGKVDLVGQRLIEIWSGLPVLYLLIILSSFVQPSF